MRLFCMFALMASVLAAQQVRDVPGVYPSIQTAITAANPGDTVLVQPGNYVESLNFLGKNIAVVGVQGAAATHIVGNGSSRAVSFTNGEGPLACLEGFTVRGGRGGIEIINSSPRLQDCVISGNAASAPTSQYQPGSDGGGVFMHALSGPCAPLISGCRISGNLAVGQGGAMACYASGTFTLSPVIQDCDLDGNTCYSGLGNVIAAVNVNVSSSAGGQVTLIDSRIRNHSSSPGSQNLEFYSQYIGLSLDRCQWVDNDGTIRLWSAPVTVRSSIIARNGSNALDVNQGTISITHSTICFNAGGLTFLGAGSTCTVLNSIIWSNGPIQVAPGTAVGRALIGPTSLVGGPGVLVADPLFVDPLNGDYHLSPDSPAVGFGDSLISGLPLVDMDGEPRVVGAVDVGADEVPANGLLGTTDGLHLFRTVNGVGDPNASATVADPGDVVRVRFASPSGATVGWPSVLIAQAFPQAAPPMSPPTLANVHLDPAQPYIELFGTLNAVFPMAGLPPAGNGFSIAVPPGLSGMAVRFQGFGLTPLAVNGIYAASAALDVVFP